MSGVQFLQNLGHTQEEVVLLQSGEDKICPKTFDKAPAKNKIILTLHSYLSLLSFFTTPEWEKVEAAAKEHQYKKAVVLEGGVIVKGDYIAAFACHVLQDMGSNVYLMVRADITDKISLSVKFVNSSCLWLEEQGCVVFDLATMKKFAKDKLSIDTAFFGTTSITTFVPPTAAQSPVVPEEEVGE